MAVALHARASSVRIAAAVGGLVAATLLHVGFDWIARRDAFGSGAAARSWTALLLPAVLLALTPVWSIPRDRTAIASQLSEELPTGAVTEVDRRVLSSFGNRQALYLAKLTRFRFREWSVLNTLHNWQVQLALIRERVA